MSSINPERDTIALKNLTAEMNLKGHVFVFSVPLAEFVIETFTDDITDGTFIMANLPQRRVASIQIPEQPNGVLYTITRKEES